MLLASATLRRADDGVSQIDVVSGILRGAPFAADCE
jgi:hypothetical protein